MFNNKLKAKKIEENLLILKKNYNTNKKLLS